MKTPNRISISVYIGDRTVLNTSYDSQKEIETFINNDTAFLPEKNRIAISEDIHVYEGKYLEECSYALLTFHYENEEQKYYCEDLSKDELVWGKR